MPDTDVQSSYLEADANTFLLLSAPDRQKSGVNSSCIDYKFVIPFSKNTQEAVLAWDYSSDVGAAPKRP